MTIQAYAPTDTADLDIKENSYDQLQLTVGGVHRYDILLIIGDFNAKVAPVRTKIESAVGPFASSRVINDNGESCCNLCFVLATHFSSKNVYTSGHGVHLMYKRTMNLTTFASGVAPGIFRQGADSSDKGAKIRLSEYCKCQKSPTK